MRSLQLSVLGLVWIIQKSDGFAPFLPWKIDHSISVLYAKGFGGEGSSKGSKRKTKKSTRLVDSLEDRPKTTGSENKPFVKSEQDDLLEALAEKSASTCDSLTCPTNNSNEWPVW
jgi:hypothetical protein